MTSEQRLPRSIRFFHDFLRNRAGNFGIMTALLAPVLIAAAGGVTDVSRAVVTRANLQELLDSGTLSAASKTGLANQRSEVESFLASLNQADGLTAADIDANLTVTANADNSLTASFHENFQPFFLPIVGIKQFDIGVSSTAIADPGTGTATDPTGKPCIWVLANKTQALLVNSGDKTTSQKCAIDVASTSNPAMIMNSGSALNVAELCLQGTQYINNGGTITNFQPGCKTDPDPYTGLTEPAVPSTNTASGTMDQTGKTRTLTPGLYNNVTFNGSQTLVFSAGLYIIKGSMIVNSGSTVSGTGVTFYFPDTNSGIQFNGNVTLNLSAPSTGTYSGILMYEKTSDATNNNNKTNFVFNGTGGSTTLSGIVHLPNRNVTFNSVSNATMTMALVVNTLIMNAANWNIDTFTGSVAGVAAATTSGSPRLVR